MILKGLHTENKPVQTQLLFEPTESKVISVQIAKGEMLKEHISKTPALLVCVSGNAVFFLMKKEWKSISVQAYML